MINHTNTSQTVYDITNLLYWDSGSLKQEMDRIYDICIGCRLCFNLCPSFPALFNAVDEIGEQKRIDAVREGRVSEEKNKERDFLDLPEGEHAVEASIEVEFRGEVSDLTEMQQWEIVDLCYQCKLCDPICPYTPEKEHDFQLDFPKLMTRAQAIRTKKNGLKLVDKFLSGTDITGKLGALIGPLINLTNKVKPFRYVLEKIVGIHRDRILPEFHIETFEKWFKKRELTHIADPVEKVVIFGTCFTNAHEPNLGKAAVKILEHNNVECVYPPQQCCGAPHLSPGDFKNFKKQAQPNVNELSDWVDRGYKIVVTGPPTCSLTIKKDYPYILGEDETLNEKIQKVAKNTFDISEFLIYLNKQGKFKTDFKKEIGTINYHLSCHLKAQKIGFKSRDLLRLVPNTKVNLIQRCSGMDGGWGMKAEFFDASMKVADRCVNDLGRESSDRVCSDCSLACHQLSQASNGKIQASHPILAIYEAYGFENE